MSDDALVRRWQRIPVLIRAVLSGVFVFVVLQTGWNALLVLNTRFLPTIPWNVPLGLLYLWVGFQYFNGRWGPASTSLARRSSMRAPRLNREQWKLALLAGAFVMVFFITFTMFTYRVLDIPEDELAMEGMPWWFLYSALVMVSIVAGVSEEAGFRGYMQGPLERRYGPVMAIGITSVAFWLLHLNHASGPARFPSLVMAGIVLGALAFAARSILPGIVAHACADIIAFVGTTAEIGPRSIWHPPHVRDTGIDGGFLALLGLVIVSGAGTIVLLPRLRAKTREVG